MTDVDLTKREQATENDRHRQKRGRLSIFVIGAIISMLLWLVLAHIIPK
jgi:predicted nucleic acid-binding Zn ribbon protein